MTEWNGTAERGYAALCKRYNLAPELFDAQAHWDSTIGYGENIKHLEEEVKKIAPPLPEPESTAKRAWRNTNKAIALGQLKRKLFLI